MNAHRKYQVIVAVVALTFFMIVGAHAQQSRNRNHLDPSSTFTRTQGPVKQCSDLEIKFGGLPVSHAEESFTVPRNSTQGLRAHVGGPFGIAVSTGSSPDYSVLVCKYATATYNSSSADLLNSIRVTAQNGEITATAPDENNWMVYLVIQAPPGAPVDVATKNGPLDLHEMSGKITASVENGPLAINRCTGEVDAISANGPVNVVGRMGRVRVRTENGPLSVQLEGDRWESGELTGSTQNGPLDLSVSGNYQSGVTIETDGYSPVHCSAACNTSQRTWNDRTRSIQIGQQPPIVRLSTRNGPVNVDTK